ncbi:HAD family phosphatase [Cyanobium sp. NS01]|uniref:HAD family hydrolase n=1 Tax=Cyanobium sp. NS01 TaxID=261284 RepID=UPI0016443583|nr:HAD family phosphatase [Cyanobium sp. NS01]QNI71221.1 HAD hydrolase/ IA/ variant 3 family protein [Cyanobium sp. NS01]
MIKAILFDMDGVLIDAKDWHYEALNRALEHFGYTISRESHLSTFDGLPTRDKLRMLSSSRGLPEGLHDFLNALKQAYTLEISYQRCKPVFNHQYALTRLRRDGYKLAVCSNSVRQSIEAMMRLSALSANLDLIVSNQDVEKGKPDPEMYLKAMKSLNVEPHECLILEDNEHGIQAAVTSGGHLLRIGEPDDVTYQAITTRISEVEPA